MESDDVASQEMSRNPTARHLPGSARQHDDGVAIVPSAGDVAWYALEGAADDHGGGAATVEVDGVGCAERAHHPGRLGDAQPHAVGVMLSPTLWFVRRPSTVTRTTCPSGVTPAAVRGLRRRYQPL
jgi:hypothetical protein